MGRILSSRCSASTLILPSKCSYFCRPDNWGREKQNHLSPSHHKDMTILNLGREQSIICLRPPQGHDYTQLRKRAKHHLSPSHHKDMTILNSGREQSIICLRPPQGHDYTQLRKRAKHHLSPSHHKDMTILNSGREQSIICLRPTTKT